jgi:hypothetical protein
MFSCKGDHSTVQRSAAGIDISVGDVRTITSARFEEVARLTPDQPTAEFWLRTENMAEPARFRFRHQDA